MRTGIHREIPAAWNILDSLRFCPVGLPIQGLEDTIFVAKGGFRRQDRRHAEPVSKDTLYGTGASFMDAPEDVLDAGTHAKAQDIQAGMIWNVIDSRGFSQQQCRNRRNVPIRVFGRILQDRERGKHQYVGTGYLSKHFLQRDSLREIY